MEAQCRVAVLELAKECLVELNAQLGVHTTLQQQLVTTKLIEAVNLSAVLVNGGYKVLICLVRLAVEVTEQTARGTDISGIYIAVNLPSDNVGVGHRVAP